MSGADPIPKSADIQPTTKNTILFAVTNDLNYDQRMIRICSSLAAAGYAVTLVGRRMPGNAPLAERPFAQKRLNCWFSRGKLFYIEYNIRLFLFLLTAPKAILGAIDLDTILPVYYVSRIRGLRRLYDAHELFCEMKEIASRPRVYRVWKWIERHTVSHFPLAYTVNQPIADTFKKLYGTDFAVVRNMPFRDAEPPMDPALKTAPYFLYQGAVNEGRSFETLIPAFREVNAPLWICGDGNFLEQAKALVRQHGLEEKVLFKGKFLPEELRRITRNAWAGITLFDAKGQSNYYSLANRFFDYIQAGIPQLCVDYPVYRELNNLHETAVLTSNLDPDSIARQLNRLLSDRDLYAHLQQAAAAARSEWNWEVEEQKLLTFFTTNFR